MPDADLVQKFDTLDKALSLELIERRDIIDTMKLALVAGVHHFQIGPPGIAKSHAIRSLRSHIGGLGPFDYFQVLLTKLSHLDDVFGPLDLLAFKEGRRRFIPEGYLPVALLAMIDEIFKCNAALLNAMLLILNEREYRNDGQVFQSPLHCCFTGSNELPESEELTALFDRLQIRVPVRDIQEPGNFIRMLLLDAAPTPGIILDWEDVGKAHDEALHIAIDSDVPAALSDIRSRLLADHIEPSARRFRECMRIMQANAWLDGRDTVIVEDTRALGFVLWTELDQVARVQRLLLEFSSPLEQEVMAIREVVEEQSGLLDELLEKGPDDNGFRVKAGVDIQQKMGECRGDIDKVAAIVEASSRKCRSLDELTDRHRQVLKKLLVEIFSLPVEMAEAHANTVGATAP